jgi:hypothetical protein
VPFEDVDAAERHEWEAEGDGDGGHFWQGLTLVHFSVQRKHTSWDTLGAEFHPVY